MEFMEFIFYLSIFIIGLIFGSFLNVVIYRLENGEDIIRDRSHCMNCRRFLAWYDLCPVLSFLALGGKCRYCQKKISWQYPSVELATAILFTLVLGFWSVGRPIDFDRSLEFFSRDFLGMIYFLSVISFLIVIFVYDLRHYIIPDQVIYPAIVFSVVYIFFEYSKFIVWNLSIGGQDRVFIFLFNYFVAALAAGGFFLSLVLITKGAGMGGGDVKLAFWMGLLLGWPKIIIALFLAFTLGAICGIILMILKKKNFKSEIPFGPFLVIGTIVALFWGESMAKWYGKYFF